MILIFGIFLATSAQGQVDNLATAFKREFSYLAVQNETLKRSEELSRKEFIKDQRSLENQIVQLEIQLSKLVSANESLNIEVQNLDRSKKEVEKQLSTLSKTYWNAQAYLENVKRELEFNYLKPEEKGETNPQVQITDYKELGEEALLLLKKSSEISQVKAPYLTGKGELKMGSLLRYGRIGAMVTEAGIRFSLVPSPEGLLKVVESAYQESPFTSLYVFEDIKGPILLKKTAKFWDKIADFIPLIILGALFVLVLSLFTLFARE